MEIKEIISAMLNEYKATGKLSVEKYEILIELLEEFPKYEHDRICAVIFGTTGGAEDA